MSEHLKEKFGAVEHKVLHGALGAFSGALLNPDDPLHGAASGAIGAFVAETAAEVLAGQQTSYTLNEYMDECGRNSTVPTQDGFYDRMIDVVANHPHRDGLVLRGNIAKVVGAAAAFAAKLDPSTAFRVAENAIENNFLFIPALVEAAAVGFAAWKAYGVLETCADAYEAYDQGGIDGLSVFIAHEGAVRFAMGRAGKAVVMVGGKAFATAKQAAQALIDRNPSLALKVADLGAITRGIELKLAHAMQDYSGGSKKMTPLLNEVHERLGGAKGVKKVAAKPAAQVKSAAKPVKKEQPEVVKKGPQGKDRSSKALVGEYRHVKGHHVHAKKAFEGHVNYDPKKGFCISNEYMKEIGVKHDRVTVAQMRLFRELMKLLTK